MKNGFRFFTVFLLLLFSAGSLVQQAAQSSAKMSGLQIRALASYGLRSMKDDSVSRTYGQSGIYGFNLSLAFLRNFLIGCGYEGGYEAVGLIGNYQEESSLSLKGLEFFSGLQFKSTGLAPFVLAGLAHFSYRQQVKSIYAPGIKSEKTAPFLAVGLNFFLFRGVFFSGRLKYQPLKVKPLEHEVDLGGLSMTVGVGYAVNL